MSKVCHFVILLAVTTYEQIYDEAIGNNGIITARHAKELGTPAIALVKLCKRGRFTRIGHGVYRIDKYFPQETDLYAAAVARVGVRCGKGAIALAARPGRPGHIGAPHRNG